MQATDLSFDLYQHGKELRLRVSHSKARAGVEGVISEGDLKSLAGFFSPKPKPESQNGFDRKLADEIVTQGYRAVAKLLHPDAGGNDDAMGILNLTIEKIRERIGR